MTCSRLEREDMLAELGGSLEPHVAQCDDCRARLREYEQLRGLIADGASAHHATTEWKRRTLARVRAAATAARRRRIAVQAGVAAATAAVLAVFVFDPGDPADQAKAPALVMRVVDRGGWRGEAHPGEELRARAIPAGAPYFDIRVYRGARDLLVQCPKAGPPACIEQGQSLIWTIPSVGTYQVLLLISRRPIAAPHGSLNDDVAAATASGATAVEVKTIRVD